MALPHSTMVPLGQPMDAAIFPAVDLQSRAGDLALRLGSLRRFLEAALELLTCGSLPPPEFRRHSRKVRFAH